MKRRISAGTLAIVKTLEASTSNITERDAELLTEGRHSETATVCPSTAYEKAAFGSSNGWFILVPAKEEWAMWEPELKAFGYSSDGFIALLKKAVDLGVAWIDLDKDGAPVPGLAMFDW